MTRILVYLMVGMAVILFIYTAASGIQENRLKRIILTDIHKTCMELGYMDYQAVETAVNEFDTWCLTPAGDIYHIGVYNIDRVGK